MNGERDHHCRPSAGRQAEVQRWASPRPPQGPYRLSDLERDEAIGALGDAYAEGRLDHAEFDLRLEAASRAVFATDLDALFVDLPRPRAAVSRAPSGARPQGPTHGRGHHPPVFVPLLFLVVLAVATHMWLLIPLAFVFASHRRRRWASTWSPGASQPVGRRPGADGSWGNGR